MPETPEFTLSRKTVFPETSVRAVIQKGLNMLRENRPQDYKDLETDFTECFVPLCQNKEVSVKVVSIPQNLRLSRLIDLAPMLTKEQGEKFCDELFSLNIPSLNQSATMIISVKNGGKIDEDVKVGFISRLILKLMYRAVVVEDITRHIAETTDLKWMDDDRRTVDRKMHIKGV